MVEFIVTSNTILKKSYDYNFLHLWLGMGLITSFGNQWRQQRKLLTPAFHFKILERFVDVFNSQAKTLAEILNLNKHEPINILSYATLYTLDVICEATMNISLNAQINPNSSYVRSVKELCRIMTERVFSLKMWNVFFRLSKDSYKEQEAVDVLHTLRDTVIENRIKEFESMKSSGVEELIDLKSKKKVPFLDLILTTTIDGKSMPQEEIRSHVDTFIFSGHDTTSIGLSFTLYCLSKHQEIQNKVFAEINSVLNSDNGKVPSYENLQKMKYLEQVVKEALRMYPPVPFFSRILTEDVTYEDKILPKDLVLVVFVFNLHYNPVLFPNPEVFDPERFNAENSKNITLCSYIPFSAGPRNCIGQKFAMLEIKAAVCKILQTFKLLPVVEHEPVLCANAVLSSQNGLPIRFVKRKNQLD
ncbi:hypothetical protein RN001_008400 [Aquatica leii]|uniref:Cytochrome P450 n=1 Tax=Aquatica leii TaxID=1421715 RepID=A0AAN7PAA2_9COLE|nr:hypothetical protein RN001_008400 [Aquatica leii]